MKKLYIVFYDCDSGDREDWNVFYTPFEIFEDPVLFKQRCRHLKSTLGQDYDLHTEEVELSTDPYGPVNT